MGGSTYEMTIGVENGPWGLLGFTDIETVHIAKP